MVKWTKTEVFCHLAITTLNYHDGSGKNAATINATSDLEEAAP